MTFTGRSSLAASWRTTMLNVARRYLAGNPSTPFESRGATTGHGTTIRFRPDPAFFIGSVDAGALEARLAEIRRDVPGSIVLVDER